MIKIKLSEEDRRVLDLALRPSNEDIITRKARIILYLADGGKSKDAAMIFRLHKKTIYRYVKKFNKRGVEGFLKTEPRPGAPRKAPENIGDIINDALKRSPATIAELETAAHNWTLKLMQMYLARVYNIFLGITRIWQIQDKHGIRHIYSKAIMTSPDPQYIEKRAVVEALKKRWRIKSCRPTK